MMRLLTAYLSRELGLSFLAVLLVLLLVIMGGEVARLLTEALEGRLSPDLVWQLVWLKLPSAMEVLLPLSVLMAVMLTFSRLYHDREMDVLAASGIDESYFVWLVMAWAGLVSLFALACALWLTPLALQQERALLAEGQLRIQVKALVAGRFMPLSVSQGVFYAEKVSSEGALSDVFIQLRPTDAPDRLLVAPQGAFVFDQGRVVLRLHHGQVYEGLLGQSSVKNYRFETLSVWLPDWQAKLSELDVEAMPTHDLWLQRDQHKMLAHWEWRWFVGLSVLLMAYMGWRLSRVGPRQGRFARMGDALLFYLLFTQLAITARAEIQRGDWPGFPGLLVMLLLPVLFLLPWRRWREKLWMMGSRGTS